MDNSSFVHFVGGRVAVRDGQTRLTPQERKGLLLLRTGAVCSDVDLWRYGFVCQGTCIACWQAQGYVQLWITGDCEAMGWDALQRKLLGFSWKLPVALQRPGMEPFRCRALPPRTLRWEPVTGDFFGGLH